MPCLRPIEILHPYCRAHPDEHKLYIKVPCGKCLDCLKRVRNQWCFRLEKEVKNTKYCKFVTLTYDDSCLPLVDATDGSSRGTLLKSDFQNFMKRLRINIARKIDKDAKIRYYACGEYGTMLGHTNRPHYHFLYFTDNDEVQNNIFSLIESSWLNGIVDIQDVSDALLNYITKYMLKDADPNIDENFIDGKYVNDYCDEYGLQLPFRLMSSKPYIGYSYEKFKNYHSVNDAGFCFPDKDKQYVVQNNGNKLSLPPIYKRKFYGQKENIAPDAVTNRLQHEKENKEFSEIMQGIASECGLADYQLDFERVFRIYLERYDAQRLTFYSVNTNKAKSSNMGRIRPKT